MKEYIAFDSHKHYTLMERQDAQTGRPVQQNRLKHHLHRLNQYLVDICRCVLAVQAPLIYCPSHVEVFPADPDQ